MACKTSPSLYQCAHCGDQLCLSCFDEYCLRKKHLVLGSSVPFFPNETPYDTRRPVKPKWTCAHLDCPQKATRLCAILLCPDFFCAQHCAHDHALCQVPDCKSPAECFTFRETCGPHEHWRCCLDCGAWRPSVCCAVCEHERCVYCLRKLCGGSDNPCFRLGGHVAVKPECKDCLVVATSLCPEMKCASTFCAAHELHDHAPQKPVATRWQAICTMCKRTFAQLGSATCSACQKTIKK